MKFFVATPQSDAHTLKEVLFCANLRKEVKNGFKVNKMVYFLCFLPKK